MKNIFLFFSIFFFSTTVFSQDKPGQAERGSRVQAYKIAFLTKKLSLTPSEAQKFWPLFNNYEDEILATRNKASKEKKSQLEREQMLLEVKKKYDKEFSKQIGRKKTDEFFKAEIEFNTNVQKELMQRRQNRNNPPDLKRN